MYGAQRARGTYRHACARARPRVPHAASVCGGDAPAAPARGFVRSLPSLCSLCSPRLLGNSFRCCCSIPGGGQVFKGVGGPATHTHTTAVREQLRGPHHTGVAVQTQPAARRGSNSVLRQLGSNVPGESMPRPVAFARAGIRGLAKGAALSTSVHSRRASLRRRTGASRAWLAPDTRWRRRRRPAARERCCSARCRVRPLSRHLSRF